MGPRPIKTSNRKQALDTIVKKLNKLAKHVALIVVDLKKPYVDSAKAAKALLVRAEKLETAVKTAVKAAAK